MTVQYQGVWTLQSAAQLQSTQRWVTDPLYKNTTLLLQADDAANGAQNNTFLDSSSNAFAITRNGNTTQGSFTPFSQAPGWWGINFNRGYLSSTLTGQAAGTGAFTYEFFFWVNVKDAPINNVAALFSTRTSGTGADGIDCQITSTGQVQIGTSALTLFTSGAGLVADNTWYHLAIVRNGSTNCTVYLNGLSIGTFSTSTNYSSTSLFLGVFGGLNDWFKGYISNFRYTKDAVYTTNFNVSTLPLTVLANTQFLTAQANRYLDASANAFAVTTVAANGGTSIQPFSPFAPQFQWTPSVIGGSGYFDGSGDYLTVANNTAFTLTGDGTIEAWFYVPTTPSTYAMIASKWGAGGGSEFILEYGTRGGSNARQIRFFWAPFSAGSAFLTSPNDAFAIGAWNHVAVCRSGTGSNNWTMYINGQVSVQGTNTTGATNNGAQLAIGAYSADGSTPITGYLTTFRMVKGTAVYTGAFTPPTRPLSDSGAASAAAYPSTTNVNTSFAASNTSILLNFTNAGIVDATMKNNLETVGNASVSTAVVKYGSGSLAFDGDTDYVGFPRNENVNLGSGNFTIEFWAYWNAFGSDKKYCLSVTDAGNYWQFNHDSTNGVGFIIGGVGSIFLQGNNSGWVVGTWYHVALVRNGTTLTVYRNGVSLASGTLSGSLTNYNTFCVGGSVGFPTTTMNGYIDDFRLTKGIARYTQNFIPPSVALPRQ